MARSLRVVAVTLDLRFRGDDTLCYFKSNILSSPRKRDKSAQRVERSKSGPQGERSESSSAD